MDVSMAQVGHRRTEFEWNQAAIFMCNSTTTPEALQRVAAVGISLGRVRK